MNWNTHINYTATKISRIVGISYWLMDIIISSVCPFYTIQYFDFTTFLLLFIIIGIINKRKSPTPLASKESVRIIDNSHYISHTEPICKVYRLLKLSDMFSIALWKSYYKLMNNKLLACF